MAHVLNNIFRVYIPSMERVLFVFSFGAQVFLQCDHQIWQNFFNFSTFCHNLLLILYSKQQTEKLNKFIPVKSKAILIVVCMSYLLSWSTIVFFLEIIFDSCFPTSYFWLKSFFTIWQRLYIFSVAPLDNDWTPLLPIKYPVWSTHTDSRFPRVFTNRSSRKSCIPCPSLCSIDFLAFHRLFVTFSSSAAILICFCIPTCHVAAPNIYFLVLSYLIDYTVALWQCPLGLMKKSWFFLITDDDV